MSSRGARSPISKVIPTGIVKESVVAAGNRAAKLFRDLFGHDRMKSVARNHARFERIHVEVAHNDRSLMAVIILQTANFPTEISRFAGLVVLGPVHLTRKVQRYEQ